MSNRPDFRRQVRLGAIIAALVFGVAGWTAGAAWAADQGTTTGKRQHEPQRKSITITKELQAAMEQASSIPELQGIVVLCANACESKQSSGGVGGQLTFKRGQITPGQTRPGQIKSGQNPGQTGTGDVALKRGAKIGGPAHHVASRIC